VQGLNNLANVPEDKVKSKLRSKFVINKLCDVPACALIRQTDGSVGFFIESTDGKHTRVNPAEEVAAARAIVKEKEEQTKLIAKRLMTKIDAVQVKFEEQTQELKRHESLLMDEKSMQKLEVELSGLASKRDADLAKLEGQAQASLAQLESGATDKLMTRRAAAVPDWVCTLTEETSTWVVLNPPIFRKKKKFANEEDEEPSTKAGPQTSWPKFVEVVHLGRHRPAFTCANTFTAEQLSTYTTTYKQDKLAGPITLDKVILTPMVVHRNLGIHYQRRVVEGFTHDEVMKEINEYCGLPVVWKGCLPFTGLFEPKRLRIAWIVNWSLFLGALAFLGNLYLTQREVLEWGPILSTFGISVVMAPASKLAKCIVITAVIWLILEGPDAYREYQQKQKHARVTKAAAGTPDGSDAPSESEHWGESTEAGTTVSPGGPQRVQDSFQPKLSTWSSQRLLVPTHSGTSKGNVAEKTASESGQQQSRTAQPGVDIYEAMQTGAALRVLEERKHKATTEVARMLVPRIDAQQKQHDEEMRKLDEFRTAVAHDDTTIAQLDARKAEKELAHKTTLKEIEAEAMLALANVEQAHEEAVANCKKNRAAAASSAAASSKSEEQKKKDSAEMAKMVEHQQAAMKIVAQHMMQQVDTATVHNERVVSKLKEQLQGLAGNSSMDAKMQRKAVEEQIRTAERSHREHLEMLEQKASVALQHVEKQHQRAVSKLTESQVASSTSASSGFKLALLPASSSSCSKTGSDVMGSESSDSQAQAAPGVKPEPAQLDQHKKARMRQQAEVLMARVQGLHTQHAETMTVLQARAANATTGAARAVFEGEIRAKEHQHTAELQRVEAQAAKALAVIEHGDAVAPLPERPEAQPQSRMSGALALAFAGDARKPVPQTEARGQAIKWLDGQERKSVVLPSSDQVEPRPSIAAAAPTNRPRIQQRTISAGRMGRVQAVRQAYESLGVSRDISDVDLDRVYAALVAKEDPANNPSELAGYYQKKSKALQTAYACIRSHRGGDSSRSSQSSEPVRSGGSEPRLNKRQSSELAI
jgi:hypothetical protein